MDIPSKIQTKYIKKGTDFVTEAIQIVVGKGFEINNGDTITIYPKHSNKINIKRKEFKIPENFTPYYMNN